MRGILAQLLTGCVLASPALLHADTPPFSHKIETHRNKEGDVAVFCLKLEQPFLAEEFEKSNYLRLEPLDKNAYLIYPPETKFHQKHAEFYGRLRGSGKARLRLAYEVVSENPDGSRKVETRASEIEVTIPAKEGGPVGIFKDWARQQNAYFLILLRYYPEDSFLEYVLLQSRTRYEIDPPDLAVVAPPGASPESGLYEVFSGALAVQQSLQRHALTGRRRTGDLTVHISQLTPPALRSLPYAELLEKAKKEHGRDPKPSELAKLVPEDHYLAHFQRFETLAELYDLTTTWGDNLLRLVRVQGRDNRLLEKLEMQLGLSRDGLAKLSREGAIGEVAVSGSDPFFHEGTDVTLILRVKQPAAFDQAAAGWLAAVRGKHPGVEERTFNYRGQKVSAHYSPDRVVSLFTVRHGEFAIYSNSHRAIRRVVDCLTGNAPLLSDALDYRYVTTLLPPTDDPKGGYFYASEAFLRRLTGPAFKIAEKRRMECFNNLVMLNNASLFYRLENGRSPRSLTELTEGGYVNPARLTCPHGGAYAIDPDRDTCSCSLHNRLRYLTPNAEVPVLQVSREEQQEYERYKREYAAFWQGVFDPIAVRFTTGDRVRLEVCVLPFANGSLYADLRQAVGEKPAALPTAGIAPSAVASLGAVAGRKAVGEFLRNLPGVPEALDADPTLTDLSWVGDRVYLHLCDDDAVLEIDPLRLREDTSLQLLKLDLKTQALMAAAAHAAVLPVYATVDVDDRDKAARLLELLATKVVVKKGTLLGLPTDIDAYRLPDYKGHARYVLTYRVYAVKVRLHLALVGNQLVAATRTGTLQEVIDAAGAKPAGPPTTAHLLVRLNRRGLDRLRDPIQLHWEEKSRAACHSNVMAVEHLARLYGVPPAEVNRLAEAKYGVTYHCPDGGTYGWNTRAGQVACSVHGNRQQSRQTLGLAAGSSFARFIESLDEVTAALRFHDEALIATVEIVRSAPKDK